jgi:RNA polymerase sigma-70 factor, ECF subfamily
MKQTSFSLLEHSLEVKRSTHAYTDETLMSRFQGGDEFAYIELVNRYRDKLNNFIYYFLGDIEIAEDIVQDTMIKLYEKKHYYKEIAKFSTWIYTIAKNLAKSELRKKKRRKTFTLSELSKNKTDYDLVDMSTKVEKDIESEYDVKKIKSAIHNLPDSSRTVIILRDIEKLSYNEISSIVEVPIGTVKSRINRARIQLQLELKDFRK